MVALDDEVYEFGPFRLDVTEKLLLRDGVALPLEPTQFDVLTVLVRAAGHLVSREELTHAVWKDTYVDDGSLTVTISMLRRKLGDSSSQPRYIATIRKSGYRFLAPVRRPGLGQLPQPTPSPASGRWVRGLRIRGAERRPFAVAAAAVIAAAIVSIAWVWPRSGRSQDMATPVPLFPFGGFQDDPSFSPDASQIAFTWCPPDSRNYDLYVLKIGELQPTRLTTDPALEKSAAWSPHGHQIAFIRQKGATGEVRLVSPTGGPEQKVADIAGTLLTWSPDGRTLAVVDRAPEEDVFSIFLLPAAGGPKRRVTFPAAEKMYGDSSPAISPDGRTLAFVRRLTYDVADIFVQPLDSATPRQLTFDRRAISGLAWISGGRVLLFGSSRGGQHQLWRIGVIGTAQPTLVEGVMEARSPTVANGRLAYQTVMEDFNIRILNRGADGAWTARSSVFAPSIRFEQSPRLSPDGRRLAFVSDRSGWFELWTCAYPGGSECRQLTAVRQGYVGSPSWSPDSQRIAFDARVDGNADIYLVRADGGPPVRFTRDSSVEARATWSQDGRWIYFRSDRTGAHEIWKMPVAGGAAIQITANGGYDALEAPDGRSLYYVERRFSRGLWTVPVDGGPAAKLPGFESLTASSWAIVDSGIIWIDATASNPPAPIRYYDFTTHESSTIAAASEYVIPGTIGFHASRNGTALMWSQLDRQAHDLMLVERFR
jgi:Tol biopolymer transport system component/DNA-binding winged helix-turn-helix (wHTH) protein